MDVIDGHGKSRIIVLSEGKKTTKLEKIEYILKLEVL